MPSDLDSNPIQGSSGDDVITLESDNNSRPPASISLKKPSIGLTTWEVQNADLQFDLEISHPDFLRDGAGQVRFEMLRTLNTYVFFTKSFCDNLADVVAGTRVKPAELISDMGDSPIRIGPSNCRCGQLLVETTILWTGWEVVQNKEPDWNKVAARCVKDGSDLPYRFQFAFASWPSQVDKFCRGIESLLARLEMEMADKLRQRG